MATKAAATKSKAAKKAPSKAGPVKKAVRAAKGNGKKACTIEGCKLPYRAKGYCFFHYKKWRHGELTHGRYKTCSTEDCRKKVQEHGLCETHFKAWKDSRKSAKEKAAA